MYCFERKSKGLKGFKLCSEQTSQVFEGINHETVEWFNKPGMEIEREKFSA